MPKVKIGRLQLLTILANLVFGKAIGYTAEVLAREVGNDAWLAMLLAFLAGFAILAVMVWLAHRFGDQPPTEYIPRLFGRIPGSLLLLGLAAFFFGSFVTSAITIEQHINDYLMTETPLLVFVIGYALVSMYGVHLGIEVIARLSVLGLLLTVLLDVLMVAGSFDHMEADRLLPLFDHGFWNVFTSSIAAHTDVAMATTASLFLLPLTGKPKRWLRWSWWGLGLGALITLVWPIFEIGVLGPEVTAQYLIACMQMARAAELSIYLHRYEMIMVVLFVYGVLTQSMVCLYCGIELTRAALPFRVPRPVVIAVLGILLMWPQYQLAYDRDRYGLFLAYVWPYIVVPLAYGIPLLVILVALLRPGIGSKKSSSPSG